MDEAGRVLPVGPSRFQVGLGDLVAWVLATGVLLTTARRVGFVDWLTPPINHDGILGFVAMGLAVLLGLALLREIRALWLRDRGSNRLGMAWRLALVGVLWWSAEEVSGRLVGLPPGVAWTPRDELGRTLPPLALVIAQLGLVAGLDRRVRPPASRRLAWLSILVAGLGGVLIVAASSWIAYLVLIAIEAVWRAMTRPDLARLSMPSLHERLTAAGLQASRAFLACLAGAVWLSASWEGRSPRRLWLVGVSSAVLALLAGGWVVLVTLPLVHPAMAEGFERVVGPFERSAILAGFAGLAFGVASRSVFPNEPNVATRGGGSGRWREFRRFALMPLLVVLLLDVILTQSVAILSRFGWDPRQLSGLLDRLYALNAWLFPATAEMIWRRFAAPQWLALGLAEIWLIWRVGLMLVKTPETSPAPIDLALADRSAIGLWLARGTGLTAVMLGALPILGVAGLVVAHFALWWTG